jgi:hypothetical protein
MINHNKDGNWQVSFDDANESVLFKILKYICRGVRIACAAIWYYIKLVLTKLGSWLISNVSYDTKKRYLLFEED